MKKDRMLILNELIEGLDKTAQETNEPEVDKTTSDRLANEIFDKIFDEAYQRMLNELQV
jgi:hypothetical protein